jgi:hypothetical protein
MLNTTYRVKINPPRKKSAPIAAGPVRDRRGRHTIRRHDIEEMRSAWRKSFFLQSNMSVTRSPGEEEPSANHPVGPGMTAPGEQGLHASICGQP